MSYKVLTIPPFDRQLKRLAKKYASIKQDLAKLEYKLQENPVSGASLGNDCYKIRLAIKSKGKGKSGGARIITHLHITATTVYLLSIYDKYEKEGLTDKELKELLSYVK